MAIILAILGLLDGSGSQHNLKRLARAGGQYGGIGGLTFNLPFKKIKKKF